MSRTEEEEQKKQVTAGGGGGGAGKKSETDQNKKKRKEVYVFGNYNKYYGYRIDRNVEEDPRLAVFRREWFEGKDCLDIGCNQGLITISIAKKYLCRSILGIDIDKGLIESANQNLQKLARTGQAGSRLVKTTELEFSNGADCLDPKVYQTLIENGSDPRADILLSRVSFQKENFVQSLHGCAEKYDTILCLSVTKWIHLNWGDDGLVILFVKIWRLLRPGGLLLLEAQPWSSYKRKRRVSETARENYKNILIHPDNFQEILLDKVGFRSAEIVTNRLSGSVAGFNRPIMAFCK